MPNKLHIRKYQSSDLPHIYALFYQTVHTINKRDYNQKQLDAWAPKTFDFDKWDNSLKNHYCLVAFIGDELVGFGDIYNNYLDRLYVSSEHQGKGIATELCDKLEAKAKGPITVHASITATPFFIKRGYQIINKQTVIKDGISMINYLMEK